MLMPIELVLMAWRLAMQTAAEVILSQFLSHIMRATGRTPSSDRVLTLRVDRDYRCQVDGGPTADGNILC